VLLATLVALAAPLPAGAQPGAPPPAGDAPRVSVADPDLVRGFIDALTELRTALADYRWRARCAIRVDDRDWLVEVLELGLERDGRLRRKLIGHEIEDPALAGPLRRRVQPLDGRGGSGGWPAEEQAVALKKLAESYTLAQPADVRRVPVLPPPLSTLQPLQPLATGSPPPPPADAPAESQFELYDLIRPGDSCQVWLDDGDGRPARLAARTDLDGAPVEIAADFSRLPDGTAYPARTTIESVVEARRIEIRIDAFGFDKLRGAEPDP
jgi:hypothetical protein